MIDAFLGLMGLVAFLLPGVALVYRLHLVGWTAAALAVGTGVVISILFGLMLAFLGLFTQIAYITVMMSSAVLIFALVRWTVRK